MAKKREKKRKNRKNGTLAWSSAPEREAGYSAMMIDVCVSRTTTMKKRKKDWDVKFELVVRKSKKKGLRS